MSRIEVTINAQENLISVWNNGNGIPIVLHEKEKIYVPELVKNEARSNAMLLFSIYF
jgi:DNA topoisomerase-2